MKIGLQLKGLLLAGMVVAAGCKKTTGLEPVEGTSRLDTRVSIGPNSKAPIEGTTFANGTHKFGIVVTESDKKTAYETGSNKTESTAVISGTTQTWTYKWGAMPTAGGELPSVRKNKEMWVGAYYPYTAQAVVNTAGTGDLKDQLHVPFDLTTTAQKADQTDWLFCPGQKVEYKGTSQLLSLTFQHVYTMVELKIKKKDHGGTEVDPDANAAKISKIEVCNGNGKDYVKNSGFFSPYTGKLTQSNAGTVTRTFPAVELEIADYKIFTVMLPPTALAGYSDGDIYIQVTDTESGTITPQPLKIKTTNLEPGGEYGWAPGKKYTFLLTYNNLGSITTLEVDDMKITDITANENVGGGN